MLKQFIHGIFHILIGGKPLTIGEFTKLCMFLNAFSIQGTKNDTRKLKKVCGDVFYRFSKICETHGCTDLYVSVEEEIWRTEEIVKFCYQISRPSIYSQQVHEQLLQKFDRSTWMQYIIEFLGLSWFSISWI